MCAYIPIRATWWPWKTAIRIQFARAFCTTTRIMTAAAIPYRLEGRNIPMGARILRVSDVFCALTSDRPYRKAFDEETAVRLMIDEIKNYDMKVFLAFQRVIHRGAHKKVRMPDISLDVRGELKES